MFYASVWRASEVKVYKNTEEQRCKKVGCPFQSMNWQWMLRFKPVLACCWLSRSKAMLPSKTCRLRGIQSPDFSALPSWQKPSPGLHFKLEWLYKSERIWYIRDYYYYCPSGPRIRVIILPMRQVNIRCHYSWGATILHKQPRLNEARWNFHIYRVNYATQLNSNWDGVTVLAIWTSSLTLALIVNTTLLFFHITQVFSLIL